MTSTDNCPNCGAPIENDICPYCGTLIWDFATIDLHKPRWIKVEYAGKIMMVRAMLTTLTMNMNQPIITTFADQKLIWAEVPRNEIDMHFVVMPDDDGIIAKWKKGAEDERTN